MSDHEDGRTFHKTAEHQPQAGQVVTPRYPTQWGYNYLGRCTWWNGLWVNQDNAHWWFDDNTEWTADELTVVEEGVGNVGTN